MQKSETKFNKVGGIKKYFKYKECEPGQVLVTGKYIGRSPNKFGKDNHDFKPEDGGPTVCLNSAGHLNYLLETYCNVGDTVQVIYEGEEILDKGNYAGKASHQFEVLVAEGGGAESPEVEEEVEEEVVEAAPVKKKVAKKVAKKTAKKTTKKKATIDLSDLD